MKWQKKELGREQVRLLGDRFDTDLLTATILARRGLYKPEEICFFLESDPRYLHNPFLFKSMEDAVDRILAARDEKEVVLVFGDRDVDGISSTCLLVEILTEMGLDARWKLPQGNDAYGLTMKAVEEFSAEYGSLVITVDCGISNRLEIERANELGIDVLVIDHHTPPDELPAALAIVNPKMADSGYPFRDLAGVGVAYKLSQALRFAQTSLYKQQICLMNIRPVNEAYLLEAVKLSNMTVSDKLSETLVPGMVDLERTRIPRFFQGQQILVYDIALQKHMLAKVFGPSVEINMYDIAPEIQESITNLKGLSLLRVKEKSRLARYEEKPLSELEVFMNVFVSFVQRKERVFTGSDLDALQLVALGTVADLMPLRDENRILVRSGLAAMAEKPRRGLSDLLVKLNLYTKKVCAQDIAWQIAPVINAAGRMGKPAKAVELFLADDLGSRDALATEIFDMNQERKKMGSDSWAIIQEPARASFEATGNRLILIGSADIHRGISGILAARLVNTFNVPSIVVSFQEDGTAIGSMRSTRGLDVKGFLDRFAELFIDYGGHDRAAGFSLKESNFAQLRERIFRAAEALDLDPLEDEPKIDIDAELPSEYFKPELMEMVERFEPFGEDFPQIVFVAKNLRLVSAEPIGKREQNHLRLSFDSGKQKWPAVFWQGAERYPRDFNLNDRVDLAFNLSKNFYNGTESLQLVVLDIKRSAS